MLALSTNILLSATPNPGFWFEKNIQPFLVDFPGTHPLTFFGWHVVVVFLAVMVILSQIAYRYNRDRLYRYYQAYAGLLLVFILTRNAYSIEFHNWYGRPPFWAFGYFVQVIYLCVCFRFGLLFLKLDKHAPVFTRRLFRYTAVVSWIAVAFYGLIFARLLPFSYASWAFYFVFLPVHVSLAGLIIYRSAKSPEAHMGYFLWGSFFYIVFALVSTFSMFYPVPFRWLGMQPILYFFIAIVAECTLFAIGLGMQLRDSIQEKYRLQTLLRDTEREMGIKVSRGQLNSHFIFNVLNSIKAFVINNQADEAADYLSKFSHFMRSILEGSNEETHSLQAELHAVLLYAEIENMRLSNSITITRDIDERIDLDGIHLPTMILQPFVENAIWHGLNQSTRRDKALLLRVIKHGQGVQVIIEDNGLGYSSKQTRETKVFAKSYGLRIVREQAERFNAGHGQQLDFEISDREGGGTRVVFTIAENPHG